MAQLPVRQKLSYAMGGMAMNLANLVISKWLLFFYASGEKQVLVPAAMFGLFFMAGRITDAVTDPLIGYWSDHTRTRWGRRIPFLALGTVPLAVVFFLLWTPPVDGQHWLNSLYVFVLIQLYFVFYTVVNTPYLALLPEISSDIGERINISTMQAVFIMVGTLVFGASGYIIENFGWEAIAAAVALVIIVSYTPTVFTIKEAPQPPADKQKTSLQKWLLLTLKNRAFLMLVVSTSLFWFGLNLLLMLTPHWVVDILGLKKDADTLMMAPFLATNIVFFFVFNYLAKKHGKYLLFLITLIGSALVVPLLTLVGQLPLGTPLQQSAFVMGLVGIPVAGFLMLPYAILADIVDFDEKKTGQRREAIFFGVQAIFQKSAIGLSIFVFGLMIHLESAESTSLLGLRVVTVIAGLACLLGFFVFLRYPIRDKGGVAVLLGEHKKTSPGEAP